jgi:tripartite-type tricarboxylate transporter receptor subunit TctC
VVIENRGGGGTLIGSAAVAKAPPDGYTLLLVSPTFTINPATRKTMPFDTARDFTPIAFLGRASLLITASNRLPVQSAGELFALAKSKPGQITYASAGLGSINQISTELIALTAGVKLAHVPYKGGAPALNDLAGGHVDIYISSIPQALQLVRSGQIRPLAVTSSKRTALLPDVPTLAECGTAGADAETWWGIVGPAGMPADIVQALNAEINKILASPELVTFLTNEGAEAEAMAPQQFGDMMRREIARWTNVAREVNISID